MFDIRVTNLNSANSSVINSGIKSGQILKLRVLSRLGLNGYKGSIAGKIIQFSSNRNFLAGQLLIVKALWHGKSLILQPQKTTTSIDRFIDNNNIPNDNLSKNILEQLKALQLTYSDKLFNSVYSSLLKLKKVTKRELQFSLLFADKNIPISAEDLLALDAFLFSDKGKNLSDRQSAFLKLFNHISNAKYQWLFSPFNINGEIKGKIGARYIISNLECDHIFFLFDLKDKSMIFDVQGIGSAPLIKYYASADKLSYFEKEKLGILFEKLGNIGFKIDDNINKYLDFIFLSGEFVDRDIDELA